MPSFRESVTIRGEIPSRDFPLEGDQDLRAPPLVLPYIGRNKTTIVTGFKSEGGSLEQQVMGYNLPIDPLVAGSNLARPAKSSSEVALSRPVRNMGR